MRSRICLATALVALVALVGACGDDDDEKAMCKAKGQLDDDVAKVEDLDLSDTSINDVTSLVSNVRDSLDNLSGTAKDELEPEIDDLQSSLDDLRSTVEDLGSADSLDEAGSSISDALESVQTAAANLRTVATDACKN